MLAELDLGADFKLPEPNTDPLYVPTPPKAKVDSVSVKGACVLKFSEDVFELEDLKTSTIKVPKRTRR